MSALLQAVVTDIERLSLKFALASWHTSNAICWWVRRRIDDVETFEVAARGDRSVMLLTIVSRGNDWQVYHAFGDVLVEGRFSLIMDALRAVVEQTRHRSIAVH